MEQNIQIAVRIKPAESQSFSGLYCWNQQSIQVADRNVFSYDYVIQPNATQQQVFEKIGFKIISNVLQGYNGCIFAYGQTGSGKTYTMTGYDPQQGIIQKCLRTLWNCVNKSQFFEIKLSYFQIYNQTVKDLLGEKENLIIRENAKSGFYVQGLVERIVEKFEDFQGLISQGISARTVKETKMNQTSSRSHSVLEVNVAYKKAQQIGLSVLKHAKITFIDLAGSQKQKQTQVQGQRLKQAANINKSLSNLSLVISKLSQVSLKKLSSNQSNQSTAHIPYRNSVLTKILKSSLTGKSKIIIICAISIEERFLDETLSTLRFAQTAKSIKMKVKKNEEEFDGTKERLFEQFQEFKIKFNQLKELLEESQKANEQLKRQNAKLKDDIQKREAEINELQINYQCLKIQSHQIARQMRSQSVNPQMSQYQVFEPIRASQNQCHSETQFKTKDFDWNKNGTPLLNDVPIDAGRDNSSSESLLNPKIPTSSNVIPPSSQLSFFTTNLSSQFSTPRKTFFTIDEADEKEEADQSSGSSQLRQKINILEKQIKKYQVEREFFLLDIDIKEEEIKSIMKRNVFLETKEKQIQQGHNLFAEMIRNKQFTHAQLKFLKLCLQTSQKDRMELELIQQEKTNLKTKFSQNTDKVKQLLLKYVQNFENNQQINIDEACSKMSFSKEKKKSQQRFSETINRDNVMEMEPYFRLGQTEFKQQSRNSQVRSQSIRENLPVLSRQEMNFISQNSKRISQVYKLPQISQSMGMMGPFAQQSSQIPPFFLQNRSMMSQSTYKFTNNELEYLKKDYDRINQELKSMKQEIDKKNIMLMQKESLLQQKQIEFEEEVDRHQKLIQDIIAQNEVRELQKKKKRSSAEFYSIQKSLTEKQTELGQLKKHLQETFRKHEQQTTNLKLQKNSLEASIQRLEEGIDQLHKQIEVNKQRQLRQKSDNERLLDEIRRLKEEIKNLKVDKGFLDSENQLLTKRYNELRGLMKDNRKVQSPKKVYRQRVSCYSLSQPQQKQPTQRSNNSLSIGHKQQQLSQQQYVEVIETKRQQDMHMAAYHFYKQSQKLYEIKELLEKKVIQTKAQLNRVNAKMKELQDDRRQAIERGFQSQKQYLKSKEMMVDLKESQVDLKNALFDKKQHIAVLQVKNKQLVNYCQLLEGKLLERQHKEFQSRQKVNDLTTQLIENSIIHRTPNHSNNPIKERFNYKRRLSSQSPDSFSSQATVVRPSSYISDSRKSHDYLNRKSISQNSGKSIQVPLNGKSYIDEERNELFKEIEEMSNEESKGEKKQYQRSFCYEGEPSIASHTLTNSSKYGQKKSKQLNQQNNKLFQTAQQIDQLQIKLKDSKPQSIKSDSNRSGTIQFKHQNRGKLSKN